MELCANGIGFAVMIMNQSVGVRQEGSIPVRLEFIDDQFGDRA
jgi:hypothetical protein